ncbi:MAG: hypothetical protein LBC41_10830 [Clostridiales bacterium]|nr:hypothetical protein [Clostridiales bacterium]
MVLKKSESQEKEKPLGGPNQHKKIDEEETALEETALQETALEEPALDEPVLDEEDDLSEQEFEGHGLSALFRMDHKILFWCGILCSILAFGISWLYAYDKISIDRISWVFWVAGMILILIAHFDQTPGVAVKSYFRGIGRMAWIVAGIATVLYFLSHAIGFGEAPWNKLGLFDDASWEIYYALKEVTTAHQFRLGMESRNLLFQHYIDFFMGLFGYSVISFNVSLLMLGWISALFTALCAWKLTGRGDMSVLASILVCFFPLERLSAFSGQRQVICTPLMMISLFFLISAVKDRKRGCAAASGLFAAFMVAGANLGEQYALALIIAATVALLFRRKKEGHLWICLAFGFLAGISTVLPVLVRHGLQSRREIEIAAETLSKIGTEGLSVLGTQFASFGKTFFENEGHQFLPNYPIIPLPLVPLVAAGAIAAFWKKHFVIGLMAIVPAIIGLLGRPYDYMLRVSAPIWVLCAVFAIYLLLSSRTLESHLRTGFLAASGVMLVAALGSSIPYISSIVKNPNSIWFLNHKEVAVAKVAQGLAMGNDDANFETRRNELYQKYDASTANRKPLAGFRVAYANARLFFFETGGDSAFSLFEGSPYVGLSQDEIRLRFKNSIESFETEEGVFQGESALKDLRLILEGGEEVAILVDAMQACQRYGRYFKASGVADGNPYVIHCLDVEAAQLEEFKEDILGMF